MTIILCFVILAELALDPTDGTVLSDIFWYINLILLIFFIVEIILQFFSKGLEFLSSCISVFDSFIVIISFVFQVAQIKLGFIALLRILRLIKVITELKK